MGLRIRKSFKVAPGVRVNLNKKSVGLSVGTRGARYTVNSSGRRTSTVGIPGTGISYSVSSSSKTRSNSSPNVDSNNDYNNYVYKPVTLAMLLVTIFLGPLGIHKFVQGKVGMGILYIFTFGLLGFGWIFDCIFTLIRYIQDLHRLK